MDRRAFVTGLGAALAVPCTVAAQQAAKVSRIGFLSNASLSAPGMSAGAQALLSTLRGLGYVEGQNTVFEFRWADGAPDRLAESADELVRLKVNTIVAIGPPAIRAAKEATQVLPIVMALEIREAGEFEGVLRRVSREHADSLALLLDPLFTANLRRVAEFATKNRLPAIYGLRQFVDAGGLMAYGPNLVEVNRRVALYVDKILRGAKPADLPVEQATKFELVINLKTAKTLGLTIPPSLLLRADQVIE